MELMVPADSLIYEYSCVYRRLKERLVLSNNFEDLNYLIEKISALAWYAWQYHPGIYADPELERKLLDISWAMFGGRENILFLSSFPKFALPIPTNKRRVLHVASSVSHIGGHTRLINNLVKKDTSSCHSLVLTRQKGNIVPEWLVESIESSGGVVYCVPQEPPCINASLLRHIAEKYADIVFLHIHPDDATPLVALAANPVKPLVFVNHADHVFSLGTGLVNTVACIRPWAAEFSLNRRMAEKINLLPIPLEFRAEDAPSREEARHTLGIADESVVILTVASAYKLIPDGKYNYFKIIKKLVDENKNVLVKIIGVMPKDSQVIGCIPDSRIELLGVVESPILYYKAADIYLDSMPYPSFTSLLEAVYYGAYPVLQYAPADKLKIADDPGIHGLVRHANDELELFDTINHAINDQKMRREVAKNIVESIKSNHVESGWNAYLNKIYHEQISSSVPVNRANISTEVKYLFDSDDLESVSAPNLFLLNKDTHVVDFLYSYSRLLSLRDLMLSYRSILSCLPNLKFGRALRNFLGLLFSKIRNGSRYKFF
ncbi:hypothetical protein IC235_00820 [Hymenobacter sp. BT664]|uniref:Glycosyltransferase n=1 Tax=Hymenobacter montanus TaxID=2771359 RepID=A0A927B966_9BACT|nr:hypothetical protein [Hymenobacter montanus]MBD2766430.1 hypothetical protein [Hymenobacter montanus]